MIAHLPGHLRMRKVKEELGMVILPPEGFQIIWPPTSLWSYRLVELYSSISPIGSSICLLSLAGASYMHLSISLYIYTLTYNYRHTGRWYLISSWTENSMILPLDIWYTEISLFMQNINDRMKRQMCGPEKKVISSQGLLTSRFVLPGSHLWIPVCQQLSPQT